MSLASGLRRRLFERLWLNAGARGLMRANPALTCERGLILNGDPRHLRCQGGGHFGAYVDLKAYATLGDRGVTLGEGFTISAHTSLWSYGAGIDIGRGFDCGPGVRIVDAYSAYAENELVTAGAPVTICDEVTLYANVVVAAGSRIGAGARVAAGSVVTGDVPPGALVGGSPARVLRSAEAEAMRRANMLSQS